MVPRKQELQTTNSMKTIRHFIVVFHYDLRYLRHIALTWALYYFYGFLKSVSREKQTKTTANNHGKKSSNLKWMTLKM